MPRAKINNVYKEFYSANKKGILELEIDSELFKSAEEAMKENRKVYIDFEKDTNIQEPLYKEVLNVISIIAENENLSKNKVYINMLKSIGKYQIFLVESTSGMDLMELWCKNKKLCYAEREPSDLTFLEKIRLYQGIDTYSFKEICIVMKFLEAKCKKYNIELSERLKLCMQLGGENNE